MDILLSIKPKYAQMIYDGTKRYEFRRRMPKHLNVGDTVYLYETAPVKAVTGTFVLGEGGIVTTDRHLLWEMTKEYAGISKVDFMRYFGCDSRACYASAMKISNAKRYENPISLSSNRNLFVLANQDFTPESPFITKPPQSFYYVVEIPF